jgi:hypothetical protein
MNERDEAAVQELMRVPGMVRASALALVDAQFTSVEELAYVPQEELLREVELAQSELLSLRASARSLLLREG